MKLLILTQAVDENNPVLGFFVRWTEEFSKHFEELTIICLEKGKYTLPKNVQVLSLGKEERKSRLQYVWRFYKYIWQERRNYDAVFVHMNEEYVVLAGWCWRIFKKKIVLWRNFKTGSWLTRPAVLMSNVVCYTSPESFTARFKKGIKMPVGIDTGFFKPPATLPTKDTVLFLGRIDPVKRVEVFVEALKLVNLPLQASLYGSPTYPDLSYTEEVMDSAQELVERGTLAIYPGITNEHARDLYQSHAIYINLSPSGSFDKTIIESMACGAIVVCMNEALRGVLPDECLVSDSPESVARSIEWALSLTSEERNRIVRRSREYAEKYHSLSLLTEKLKNIFES